MRHAMDRRFGSERRATSWASGFTVEGSAVLGCDRKRLKLDERINEASEEPIRTALAANAGLQCTRSLLHVDKDGPVLTICEGLDM